jgi:drug/metabolite transporter (DMT)-like permease
MIISWIALGTSFIATAWGQVTYKLFSQTRHILFFALAVSLFITAQISNYVALHNLPIGTVYIGTGVTHVLVLLLSSQVLKERITRDHLVAVLLIVSGLVLFSL